MLNEVTPEVLDTLKSQLPDAVFGAETASYTEDPRRILKGQAAAVLRPGSTQEVAKIVRLASQAKIGVIPYGGGTGLVGGQLAPDGPRPIVVSVERLNKVRGIYPTENVLVAEAGVTLADVQAAAESENRLFPLSLASEGTARIGGNLSTNAGGVQVLRFGNTRELCLGLEAVLPSGEIWNGLKRLRKDNTGYDLRNLLIGAEGTLGIITACSMRLFPRPGSVATALIAVPGPDSALDLLSLGQDRLGAGLTAFELMHRQGFEFLAATGLPGSDHLSPIPEWAALVEIAFPDGFDAQSHLEGFFAAAFDVGLALDGVVAQSEAQRSAIWASREFMNEANKRIGAVASHDISVPLSAIPKMITRGQESLNAIGDFRYNIFGHLGDGNLHLNVFPALGKTKSDYPGMGPQVSRILHDIAHDLGGSFSAEHGVGRLKRGELERLGDPVKLGAMRLIKDALDPAGIMNPGAVLPPTD